MGGTPLPSWDRAAAPAPTQRFGADRGVIASKSEVPGLRAQLTLFRRNRQPAGLRYPHNLGSVTGASFGATGGSGTREGGKAAGGLCESDFRLTAR